MTNFYSNCNKNKLFFIKITFNVKVVLGEVNTVSDI